jgi:hypothetical protein
MRSFLSICCLVLVIGAEQATALDTPSASQDASKAPGSDLLGSLDFQPTSDHPVGIMGEGNGCFPGATNPCLRWQVGQGQARISTSAGKQS